MNRIIAIALLLPALAYASDSAPPIRMKQGEEKILDVGDYTRLAIGQPDVVGVTASKEGGQLTVVGRSAGKTTLLVWQKKGGRATYLIDVRADAKAQVTPEEKPAIAAPAPNELVMFVGEQKTLTIPGISRLAVGDPEIADIRTLGKNEVFIQAGSEGRTTVMVWKAGNERLEYEVNVKPTSQATTNAPVIALKVGERRTLDFAGAAKIGRPDAAIVGLELGEKQRATVVGTAAGETILPMWNAQNSRIDFRIVVTQ